MVFSVLKNVVVKNIRAEEDACVILKTIRADKEAGLEFKNI